MLRTLSTTALCLALAFASGPALADVQGGQGENVQEGDNRSDRSQSGDSTSGDAISGQVFGVTSAGETTADLTNTTRDGRATTGDSTTGHDAAASIGHVSEGDLIVAADILFGFPTNVQEGNNEALLSQVSTTVSGDAVDGQVAGIATISGTTTLTATNRALDTETATGAAESDLDLAATTGLPFVLGHVVAADITLSGDAISVQEGDDSTQVDQDSRVVTGDAVAGQITGTTNTSGTTVIDASNDARDAAATTGAATADHESATATGLTFTDFLAVTADILVDGDAANVQEGHNAVTVHQASTTTTGDAIAGQITGSTNDAGTMTIAAANTTSDTETHTGDGTSDNDNVGTTGLVDTLLAIVGTDISVTGLSDNVQEGSNAADVSQGSTVNSGDAIAGQVTGAANDAGDTAIHVTNAASDIDTHTGDANSDQEVSLHTGQAVADVLLYGTDITSLGPALNVQEGDNTAAVAQVSSSSTGDAVAGQVTGVSTSPASTTDVRTANAVREAALTTGDVDHRQDDAGFVGLTLNDDLVIVG